MPIEVGHTEASAEALPFPHCLLVWVLVSPQHMNRRDGDVLPGPGRPSGSCQHPEPRTLTLFSLPLPLRRWLCRGTGGTRGTLDPFRRYLRAQHLLQEGAGSSSSLTKDAQGPETLCGHQTRGRFVCRSQSSGGGGSPAAVGRRGRARAPPAPRRSVDVLPPRWPFAAAVPVPWKLVSCLRAAVCGAVPTAGRSWAVLEHRAGGDAPTYATSEAIKLPCGCSAAFAVGFFPPPRFTPRPSLRFPPHCPRYCVPLSPLQG